MGVAGDIAGMAFAGAEDVIACEQDSAQISYARKHLESFRTYVRETYNGPITIAAANMLVNEGKAGAYDPTDPENKYLPIPDLFTPVEYSRRAAYERVFGGAAKLKVCCFVYIQSRCFVRSMCVT